MDKNPEKKDIPQNWEPEARSKSAPGRPGLWDKLQASGALAKVAEALKAGDTLKQVAELCGRLGHPAEVWQIYRIKQRCQRDWEESEFRRRAMDAHIEGAGDGDTTMEVLIDRMMVAKFAGMIEDAEGPDALATIMPLWTAWKRMRTAERAEARAERAEERTAKELSKQVATRFLDMINSEDMAAKARAVRDGVIESGGGIEKQVEAIQEFLWGDVFSRKEAA